MFCLYYQVYLEDWYSWACAIGCSLMDFKGNGTLRAHGGYVYICVSLGVSRITQKLLEGPTVKLGGRMVQGHNLLKFDVYFGQEVDPGGFSFQYFVWITLLYFCILWKHATLIQVIIWSFIYVHLFLRDQRLDLDLEQGGVCNFVQIQKQIWI